MEREYLTLRSPLGLRHTCIFRTEPTAAVEAANAWVQHCEGELKDAGLIDAAARWVKAGRIFIACYQRQLDRSSTLLTPIDIAVSWLRALYDVAGCTVDVQGHDGIIELPVQRESRPADYRFLTTLIAIAKNHSLARLSGRGALKCRIGRHGPWSRVSRIKLTEDQTYTMEFIGASSRSVTICVDPNEIRPSGPLIELLPLGSLRVVHLASFGIPAHVPWYVKAARRGTQQVWGTSANIFVFPHAPLRTTERCPFGLASGSYLWDSNITDQAGQRRLVEIASTQIGTLEDDDVSRLTTLA